ncbi:MULTISPECIES: DUF4097 family beta strand repeat-containing protein [Streptacidiphilus]|uniref:DUF4097 family beta strand repeat-containing protein n=1 Tax=Streptacidiphilus cavernicola TaxID=3342716 RepID=A0ABV6UK88_9ACTN|nr:DUF4097 family beta strand repeat-containing protein [Streptacidiphilus jeojiense]
MSKPLRFTTPAPVSVHLDIPAGQLRLTAADLAQTLVAVLPADAAEPRDVKAAERTTVEFAEGVLRIQGPKEKKNQLLGPTGSVVVTVQLPTGSGVEAKAASAELHSTGQLDFVAFDGALGTIELDACATLRVTSAAGDVTVGRLGGDAHISTGEGDIRIGEAAAGALVLRTQSGSIAVNAAPGVSATMNAGTTLGRIDNALRFDGVAALTIHATTLHGDITARSLDLEDSLS